MLGKSAMGIMLERVLPRIAGTEFDGACVYIDSPRTIFVPEELAGTYEPEQWLAAAGIGAEEECSPVVTAAVENITAVTLLPNTAKWYLEHYFHGKVEWLSPLHEAMKAIRSAMSPAECTVAYPTVGSCYLLQYDADGLPVTAEVYPLHTAGDMIFALSALVPQDRRKQDAHPIYIYGDRPPRYTETLRRYFRRVEPIRIPRQQTARQ